MDFKGLLPVLNKRPLDKARSVSVIARDSLQLSTWLCVGAVLQGGAFLAIGRLALLPATLVLVYRMLEAYAITTGLKHNPYMEDVIMEKHSAQFPDDRGRFGNEPCSSDVAVLLIGTRSNHPMGMLAPGFKDVGAHMAGMVKNLKENADEHGFLGTSSFLGMDRSTNNNVMNVMYFKNSDYVHTFAQGQLHRDGLNWWNKTVHQYPHLSIYHELYQVPKGHWESIYVQAAPTGVAATLHHVAAPSHISEKGDMEAGEQGSVWMSPIVDARKGVLKNSAGRMGRISSQQ